MTNEENDFDSVFNEDPVANLQPVAGVEPEQEKDDQTHMEREGDGQEAAENLEKPEGEAEENTKNDEDRKLVPLAALHEVREEKRALKSEIDQMKSKFDEVAELNKQLLAHLHQPQAQTPEEPQFIDPLDDPQAFTDGLQTQVKQMIEPIQAQLKQNEIETRENQSYFVAQAKYGDETVDAAIDAAYEAGLSDHFRMNSNSPVIACVEWHKQQLLMNETGGDLETFRANIEKDIRAKVQAELNQENSEIEKKQVSKDLVPPSLNKQTSSGNVTGSESDEDFFNGTFT